MNTLLVIAFLFFIGSLSGWTLELFYRRFFSAANPERKWINPGFLVGPYLPLYGFSLSAMFVLSYIPVNFIKEQWAKHLVLFAIMAIFITFIEYLAGLIFIKGMKIKLWDYSKEWGNIKGIICPKFSFYWLCLSAIYYFLIHPRVLGAVYWLANHLTFSFFIGFFYGVFTIDFVYSMKIMAKIRKFAVDNNIQVRIEEFKAHINAFNEKNKEKTHFLLAFKTEASEFSELLKQYTAKLKDGVDDVLDDVKDEITKRKKH